MEKAQRGSSLNEREWKSGVIDETYDGDNALSTM
jgi:hypothetical protein